MRELTNAFTRHVIFANKVNIHLFWNPRSIQGINNIVSLVIFVLEQLRKDQNGWLALKSLPCNSSLPQHVAFPHQK